DTRNLRSRRSEDLSDAGGRRGNQADQFASQFIERRQGRERLDAFGIETGIAHRTAKDDELVVRLGEFGGDLRGGDGIIRIGDDRRALEKISNSLGFRTLES